MTIPSRGALGDVWWLEEALARDPGAPCPPLAGPARADVCVVGGGFTGLWAAIEVRLRSPDTSVTLLEAHGCGFGASGRNGGWVTGWHDELDRLEHHFGVEAGRWLAAQSAAAIDRIETFTAERGIACDFRRLGGLCAADAPAQVGLWAGALAACRAAGRGDRLEPVDGEEVRRRTGSPVLLDAVRQTDAAAVQPALLVRGLRRVALELGVRIHEGTPMTGLDRGRPARVRTIAGHVDADVVVLALNAWAARIRELRRAIAVIPSHIVLTVPVPDRLRGLDWARGELLGDARLLVHYAQVTPAGRIVFGRGGGRIGPGGRVVEAHFRDPAAVRSVAADFRRWFPQLADVELTHAWGGPVDRSPAHVPFAGTLGDHGNVHYVAGYSGNGVGPSAFLGAVVGRLALGVRDEHTGSPLAAGPIAYLPPEPLRSAGGAVVQAAVRRAEAAEEAGRAPDPISRRLRPLVAVSTPRLLEPRRWRRREHRSSRGGTG